MKFTTKLAALALALAATGAQAGSITYFSTTDHNVVATTHVDQSNDYADYTNYDLIAMYLPQFNVLSYVGQHLVSAQFTAYGELVDASSVTRKTTDVTGHINSAGSVTLFAPDGTTALAVALPHIQSGNITLTVANPTYAFGNDTGNPRTVTGLTSNDNHSSGVLSASAADLAGFVGGSYATVLTSAEGTTGWSGGSNAILNLTAVAWSYASVTYIWAPDTVVPEPASLALLGLGLAGVAASAVRRRRA